MHSFCLGKANILISEKTKNIAFDAFFVDVNLHF